MNIPQIKKQQGAVLIVALVMLTVLTLLGVSNMSSSTLDLKMASNSRASFNSFQSAYSAISGVMGDGTIDFTNLTAQTKTYSYKVGTDSSGTDIVTSVAVDVNAGQIVDGKTIIGQSWGSAAGGFMLREIVVVGTNGTSNSVQIQGVSQRVAGGSSL